jgi:membrane protein implicated in regulation of membrane protease activity
MTEPVQKLVTLVLLGVAALCVWIGAQMEGRDPLWWIFVYAAPATCLAILVCYWYFRRTEQTEEKKDADK